MLNIAEKINKLPQEVQDSLLSDFGNQLENEIFDKYQIPGEKYNFIGDTVLSVYLKELKLAELVVYVKDGLGVDENTAKKISLDLAGMRFIAAERFLEENVRQFIVSLGGKVEEYEKYIAQTKEEIEKEKKGASVDGGKKKTSMPADGEEQNFYEFNPEQEKEDSLAIFSSSLADLLEAEGSPHLEDYNFILIELLENGDFRKNLENALFSNQEILTDKDFVFNGKKQMSTISNWLKDFIKRNGSGMFDNLALSQYLSGSENAKKLDSQEKKLLHKLLILYRNLKFFPESMGNAPAEEWEIIPLDDEDKPFKKLQKTEKKDERLVELESLLEQYEEGSLERKAIEEEIVRTTD